jgi:VWFA-related protein
MIKAEGRRQKAEVWNELAVANSSGRLARVSSFLTFAFCLLPSAFLLSQSGPTPQFRAGAVLVTVDAYPQQNGQIVEGLTPEDFEVLEDGKVQKVEAFDFVRIEPAVAEGARRDPNTVGEANALAADPKNRVFVVYLDVYHVRVGGSYATRQPLVDTLTRVLGPSDLFGVMTPRMRARDLTLGRRLDSIDDQLRRNWPWGERDSVLRDPEEDRIARCASGMVQDGANIRPVVDLLLERLHEDKTLTTLEDLVAHLGTLREARTDVLLFTDGWLLFRPDANLANAAAAGQPALPGIYSGPGGLSNQNRSSYSGDTAACRTEMIRLANLDDSLRFRELMTEANRHNITFYPVNPGGLAVFDSSLSSRSSANPYAPAGSSSLGQDLSRLTDRVQNLRTLAENTDGIAVVDTNDLNAGLRRVVNDVSAYYLLGYYSTNTKLDGKYHRIQVKMKRPNVTVKARRGYFAPSETTRAGVEKAAAVAAAGPSPIDEALAALARVRSTSDVFTYGAVSTGELRLVAEIASELAGAGKWAQGADVQAAVTGPNGESVGAATGKIEPAARGALLRLALPPGAVGPWRAAVKITSGADTLEDRATIDVPSDGVLLGAPVVYRAAPGPRSPLRPVADFQFRRTERVHLEFPMLKPLEQRQARLLGRTGQPLAIAATVTERDASTLAVDVNLAPLGPGNYVVEVTAGAGAETERRLVAIRVIQ